MIQEESSNKKIIVSSQDIALFSQCPLKFTLSKAYPSLIEPCSDFIVITNVIKRLYLFRSEYQKNPTWKNLIAILDEELVIYNVRYPAYLYKISKNLLNRIKIFYSRFCEDLNFPALPNFPIYHQLNNHIRYEDSFDLIGYREENNLVYLLDFYNYIQSKEPFHYQKFKANIKYNLGTMIKICSFFAQAEKDVLVPEEYYAIVITKELITVIPYKLTEIYTKNVQDMLELYMQGIQREIENPIYSPQCLLCKFHKTEYCP